MEATSAEVDEEEESEREEGAEEVVGAEAADGSDDEVEEGAVAVEEEEEGGTEAELAAGALGVRPIVVGTNIEMIRELLPRNLKGEAPWSSKKTSKFKG